MAGANFSYGDDARSVFVVAAQGVPATCAAIELAGWHVAQVLTPAQAPDVFAAGGRRGVAVLDVAGTPDSTLHETIALVARAAEENGWPLAIVASTAQIDLVVDAAPADTPLLCEPAARDWPVMLALAAGRGSGGGGVRESERERLERQLNAEIARIAAMLAELTRTSPAQGRSNEQMLRFAPAPGDAVSPSAVTIRATIRARRMRDRFFGAELFADPAWDMLLDLFAAELEGVRVSVSSLCIAAAVPPTTALRWISTLSAAGLLARVPDPEDRRRAFLSLSDAGSTGMRRYAGALHEAGLSFV